MTYLETRKAIQRLLCVTDDGDFGPKTRAAFDALAAAKDVATTGNPDSPAVVPESASGVGDHQMVDGRYCGIIDINHANSLDLAALKSAGFGAIIHKATEGLTFRDPKYAQRKRDALAAGFLWGAYHFAAGTSAREQAMHFLANENGRDPRILMCLDFEPSSHGEDMTLDQAREFIRTVQSATGRACMIYGGGGMLREAMDGRHDELLAGCPLWLCDMREHPRTILPTWPTWTLLQYTDGQIGQQPKSTPGSDGADRNSYAGTLEDLRKAWPFA